MIRFVVPAALYLMAAAVTGVRGQALTVPPQDEARLQKADAAYADAERALTVRLLDRCLAQADTDHKLLADAQAKAKSLATRLTSLATSDEGKRLAANLDALSARQITRIMSDPSLNPESLQPVAAELAAATDTLKKLKDQPPAGFVPPDAQQDELTKIALKLNATIAQLNERGTWLDGQIAAAPRDMDLAKAPTLNAMMADFRQSEQKAWADAQRLGIEQAQPQAREHITAAAKDAELERSIEQLRNTLAYERAERDRDRLDTKVTIARMSEEGKSREDRLKAQLAEAQAKREVQDAHNDVIINRAQQEAEFIRKRQECKRPEVLAALKTFTTPGYWQPGTSMPSAQRQPMSFNGIRASGALAPNTNGLRALFELGQNRRDTLRPRWGFRTFNGNFTRTINVPENYEQLQKVQQYLTEYGEALAAEGYLSK